MPLYEAQTWANGPGGGTPISAPRLNHMESGILDSSSRLAVVEPQVQTKAPILTPTGIKTATYAAVNGDLVRVDATAGPISITLPAAAPNLLIAIKKIDSSANAVTITPAGADTIDSLSSIALVLSREARVLVGVAGGWIVQTGLTTVSSLDARYALTPALATGSYHFTSSPGSTGTANSLGVGTMRLIPWLVTTTTSLTRIGGEVTSAGDAGSKVRLVIYSDTGGKPGALVLNAGQINGDSATVQELTIAQTLTPGLYWIGGIVQTVTTTQPTMRTVSAWTPPIPIWLNTTIPTANLQVVGVQQTGVTAAPPDPCVATGPTTAALRLFVKTA